VTGTIEKRIEALGLTLPTPPKPVASYVPFVIVDKTIYVSGQVTMGPEGLEYIGKLGRDLDVEQGQAAAQLCGLNIIAQLKVAAGGDLDQIKQIVRLGGFVNSTDDFKAQPQVINGASDLMQNVFGESGRHARAAVGVNALPAGVAVEIDAVAVLT
jgi:enamine deaminase RidA (YjgF/YER057c/UK114 family)